MPDEPTADSEKWPDDVWATPDDADDPGDDDSGVDGPGVDDGFDDRFDDFMGDRSGDEFEHGPESGGAKGRILVGVALLVIGVIVAIIAVTSVGDDDGDSTASKSAVKSATTTAAEEATTTAPPTIVPTTLANGALATGCSSWDPAFSFEPKPLEGIALYSDFNGWHVVLAPDGPKVLTGTVKGQTTPVVSTEPQPEGVQVIADPTTQTVTFRLTAGDEPVGFDFAADCSQKQLTIDLKNEDGSPVDASVVHLGRNGGTTALPVIAQRQQPAPG